MNENTTPALTLSQVADQLRDLADRVRETVMQEEFETVRSRFGAAYAEAWRSGQQFAAGLTAVREGWTA